MSAFDLSKLLFNFSTLGYALSIIFFSFYMVIDKKWLTQGTLYLLSFTWALHTLALLLRWYEAGIGHPPWSNLYESLVFFGWGITTMSLYAMLRFGPKARFAGLFASSCTFLALGMATLYHNHEIEPLVPALQSKWILFHVFNGCMSYALFIIASACAYMQLIKERTKDQNFGKVLSLTSAFFIWVVAGNSLFTKGVWEFVKVQLVDGKPIPLQGAGPNGQLMKQMIAIPGGGPLLLIAFFLLLGASVLWFASSKPFTLKVAKWFHLIGTLSLLGALVNLFIQSASSEAISPTGNPFRVGILSMLTGMNLFLLLIFKFRDRISERLPSTEVLDSITYKLIFIGFPFQTLLLITGAIWAYSAWGRYWGWDPKETWALITWFYYAIYLHLRMVQGWTGPKIATYAAIGFGIVVFAFLGVNIALSGLHSYGAA